MTAAGAPRPGEVRLRWLAPDEAGDRIEAWLPLLSEEERARAARFHVGADRAAYVAAHALLRVLLAGCGVPHPRFEAGPWGRPELVGRPGGLRFSLTHTRSLVAAAVAAEDDLGLDVEAAGRTVDALGLAGRFFAPAEAAYLSTLSAAAVAPEFLRIWTLKEAFVKAVGLGLALPLDRFAFGATPGAFTCAAELGDPAAWSFRTLALPAEAGRPAAWLSVALRRPAFDLDAAPLDRRALP